MVQAVPGQPLTGETTMRLITHTRVFFFILSALLLKINEVAAIICGLFCVILQKLTHNNAGLEPVGASTMGNRYFFPKTIKVLVCASLLALATSMSPVMIRPASAFECTNSGAAGVSNDGGSAISTACGGEAAATGSGATAVGFNAQATGNSSTALGLATQATVLLSTAVGAFAQATQTDATALGAKAQATNTGAIAIGGDINFSGAGAAASGTNAIAIGSDALANQADAIAVGHNASATAANSVALGAGSVADEINTVAIGGRRITDVAAGTASTDAVTKGQLDTATGTNATAITTNATAITTNATGITTNATAITTNTTGITTNATAITTNTTGIGTNALDISQLQSNSIIVGQQTNDGTAIGEGASVTGTGGTAFGSGASAETNDVAIGFNANATADGAVVIGANSVTASVNSVAVGADSGVSAGATGGTAVGQNAQVLSGATDSVALGRNSVASEANTVSVGSVGSERRITNVAAGVNATDAVNFGQLSSLQTESRRGIAAASAFMDAMPSAPGKTRISFGAASFHGEQAVSFNVARVFNPTQSGIMPFMIGGISNSTGGETIFRIGGGFEF